MKAKVYTVKLYGGRMGIMYATKASIIKSVGSDNITLIKEATSDDVRWAKGMGGYIPPEAKKLLEMCHGQ